jgi:hypothetical protein
LIAERAGFGRPQARPIFLNVETAQYYLQQAIDPLLRQGYFDPNVVPLTMPLSRLLIQILENLNKAALTGLPHTQVGQRLTGSLATDPASRVAFEHTQACMNRFREFCLAHNLLDFSLRIDTFYRHLWPVPGIRQFLIGRYRHLIVDNIEEDNTFAHNILREWLPNTASALLINDEDAGFRTSLGANWRTAQALAAACDETVHLAESRVASAAMLDFGQHLAQAITGQSKIENPKSKIEPPFFFEPKHFYPQMIDGVIDRIAALIGQGTPPGQIVVVSPFVSDALRFSFIQRMARRGLSAYSHRPSRPLSQEPAAKTILTLARLAFPGWGLLPQPLDLAHALSRSIAGLDLIRANLLVQIVYHPYTQTSPAPRDILTSFDQIEGAVRERISEQPGARFDELRSWLLGWQIKHAPVLNQFFSDLFETFLSQPGFGFHAQPEADEIVANLIDSARTFRRVVEQVPLAVNTEDQARPAIPDADQLNRAYLETIDQDITAALYLRSWQPGPEDAVLIAPITTFLMSNRPVDYQFWLDAGSHAWWENMAQPLTHPQILAADWEAGHPWTDAEEVTSRNDRLSRLVLGLTRRCRKQIFIAHAEIGEQGYEQRGRLLMVLQQMLRQIQVEKEKN